MNQINFGSVSGTGAGQTIAIIDSYFDPNISSDLAKFDSQYGLSAPPSFTQYVENGLAQDNSGWALETALDVEWAHAIAPAANIVLVEARPDLNDLFSAVSFASQLSGVSVVSMSWGTGEFSGETAYDGVFTTPAGHNGVTFVASSGDSGTTEYPSASPNVLSVGGTTLSVTGQGGIISETGWSGSGSGSSSYESQPTWQTAAVSSGGLSSGSRTTPDVAWDANPSTGVSVYDSVPYYGQSGGWFTVGGTSVGAPSWAGLIAIADQGLARNGVGSLSNAQASLYQLSSTVFNHPTSGSNGSTSSSTYGLVAGLGSPKANLLVPARTPQFPRLDAHGDLDSRGGEGVRSGRGGSLRSPSSISDEPDNHRDREQLVLVTQHADFDHCLEPDPDLDPDHGESDAGLYRAGAVTTDRDSPGRECFARDRTGSLLAAGRIGGTANLAHAVRAKLRDGTSETAQAEARTQNRGSAVDRRCRTVPTPWAGRGSKGRPGWPRRTGILALAPLRSRCRRRARADRSELAAGRYRRRRRAGGRPSGRHASLVGLLHVLRSRRGGRRRISPRDARGGSIQGAIGAAPGRAQTAGTEVA